MKINFDLFKEKINFDKVKTVSKDVCKKYHKLAGSVAVVTALCAVCTVSLIDRISANNQPSGIMMTLADVAEHDVAFSGNTFCVAGIGYSDMISGNYEAEQLAQLEKSEKQVEEILLSNHQDKIDQAVLDALTAQSGSSNDNHTHSGPSVTTLATAEPTYADENGSYVYAGDFVLTAYCPCPICCGIYSNMTKPTTASGTIATAGRTIAADTSVFPFGTQLVINGQIYTVEDRGGAIVGNRIDIFFNSHEEALIFGRRSAAVYYVQ